VSSLDVWGSSYVKNYVEMGVSNSNGMNIYIYIHINLALFAQNPLQPAASLQGRFFISTYDGFDGSDWHEHLWQTYLGSLFSRVHSTGQVARNLLNENSQCI
jgi:hypothetical protein